MSKTKKLGRARRREAKLRVAARQLQADYDNLAYAVQQLIQQRRDIEEELRPAVEKIMAVRMNGRWYIPQPMAECYAYLKEPEEFTPSPTRMVDTHRKLEVTYAIADEVLIELLGKAPHPIVEEFFLNVGKRILVKALADLGVVAKRVA